MKAAYAIPVATLALAVALVARAEPAAPLGGAPGTANYNPKELQVDKIQSARDAASGQATPAAQNGVLQESEFVDWSVNVRNAPPSDAKSSQASGIQSPRDLASGQATGNRQQGPGTSQGQNKLGNFEIQDVRGGTVMPGGSQPEAQDHAGVLGAMNNGDLNQVVSRNNRATETAQTASITSPRDQASGQASTGRTSAPDGENSFSAGQDTRMDSQIARDGTAQTGNSYFKIEGIDGESKVNANPGAGEQLKGSSGDGQGIRKPRPNNRPRKGKRMHKP